MCRLLDISLMPVREQNVAKIHDASTSMDGKMDVNDAFASAFQEFNESSSMQTTETSLSGISGDDCDATLASGEEKGEGNNETNRNSNVKRKKKKEEQGGSSWHASSWRQIAARGASRQWQQSNMV